MVLDITPNTKFVYSLRGAVIIPLPLFLCVTGKSKWKNTVKVNGNTIVVVVFCESEAFFFYVFRGISHEDSTTGGM